MAKIFTTEKSPVGKVNKQDFHLSTLISCVIDATILLHYQYVYLCVILVCVYTITYENFLEVYQYSR